MVLVAVRARMRHLLPRPVLSVDPHLQVDDRVILRLTRQPQTMELELAEGDHVFAVVPSGSPVSNVAQRIEQSGLIRSEVGRRLYVDGRVGAVDVVYRPFPIQAWMTRGSLRVQVERRGSGRG